jgi:hypothetical protein
LSPNHQPPAHLRRNILRAGTARRQRGREHQGE